MSDQKVWKKKEAGFGLDLKMCCETQTSVEEDEDFPPTEENSAGAHDCTRLHANNYKSIA